jgi:hypothetical protein
MKKRILASGNAGKLREIQATRAVGLRRPDSGFGRMGRGERVRTPDMRYSPWKALLVE